MNKKWLCNTCELIKHKLDTKKKSQLKHPTNDQNMIIQQRILFILIFFIVYVLLFNFFFRLGFVAHFLPFATEIIRYFLVFVWPMMMMMILLMHFQYCFALLILWRMLIVFAARSSLIYFTLHTHTHNVCRPTRRRHIVLQLCRDSSLFHQHWYNAKNALIWNNFLF